MSPGFKKVILFIAIYLLSLVLSQENEEDPINDNVLPSPNDANEPHEVLYYVSNPWIIAVGIVVGIVVLFNISMICYIQCSPKSGKIRASFWSQNKRKGYSNVANADSDDLSNSEMEQINIE